MGLLLAVCGAHLSGRSVPMSRYELIVTVAALLFFSESAFAKTIFVHIKGTWSQNRINTICSNEGGTSTTGPGGHYGCAKHAAGESALSIAPKAVNVLVPCPHTNLRAPPITSPFGPEAYWQDATDRSALRVPQNRSVPLQECRHDTSCLAKALCDVPHSHDCKFAYKERLCLGDDHRRCKELFRSGSLHKIN